MICWVCDHPFTHCICSFLLLAFFFQFAAAALVQTLIPPLINLGFIRHQVHSFGNIISKGWWSPSRHDDSSSTSFSPVVRDSERCHAVQRGWVIPTEGTWATVSFSAPSSHTSNWHCPFFYEEMHSTSSGAAQTVLNEIQFCPSFIRATSFLGDNTVEHYAFPRGTWPSRGMSQAQLCSSHLPNQGITCVMSKEYRIHTPWFFFSTGPEPFFSYIMTVLLWPCHKQPINTKCIGSAENTILPSGRFSREINLIQQSCLSDFPRRNFWTW